MAHGNVDGILGWTNSIRLSMANDPGRQFFEDQIQTHGFLFLDDYLDNILAGAKQNAVIELVKTPSRKKDAPRRTRAATAAATKMKSVISLSLDGDDTGKENMPPINNFHKALLHARDKSDDDHAPATSLLHPSSNGKAALKPFTSDKSKAVTIAEVPVVQIQEVHNDGDHMGVSHDSQYPSNQGPEVVSKPQTLAPTHSESNELSIIAEDDEPAERSQHSVQVPSHEGKSSSESTYDGTRAEESVPVLQQDTTTRESEPYQRHQIHTTRMPMTAAGDSTLDVSQSSNINTSSSTNTFHSIPLDSPVVPVPATVLASSGEVLAPTTLAQQTSELENNGHNHNLTAPLPPRPPVPQSANEALTAPLPSTTSFSTAATAATVDYQIPLRDASPPRLVHKKSVPLFPSLPAPSPLRKSTRGPSMGLALGAPTPRASSALTLGATAPTGGKRTSWLQKAREAKAMEGPMVATFTAGKGVGAGTGESGGLLPSAGSKRKSGEMLAEAELTAGTSSGERKTKMIKLGDGEVGISKAKGKQKEEGGEELAHMRSTSHPSPVEQPPLDRIQDTPDLKQDDGDMIDRFKRKIEGLGARVGMGKSLGGAAAATALAEARAAAEARVAERNKVESKVAGEDGAGATMEVKKAIATANTTAKEELGSQSPAPAPAKKLGNRLSVSDLVTSYEGKETVLQTSHILTSTRGSNSNQVDDFSTSTTPPNSPPIKRPSSFILPGGPVFNKPPVFVPPAARPPLNIAKADPTKEFSFNLPPSKLLVLPPAVSLGVMARLSPQEQGSKRATPALSAQSTLASIYSDAIFEREEGGPAWMPSTQDTDYSPSVFGSQTQIAPHTQNLNELDDDDSWPLEKVTDPKQAWAPFGSKEDSMTWSTLPTESQRGDTGHVSVVEKGREEHGASNVQLNADDENDDDVIPSEADRDMVMDISDLEDMDLEGGKSPVNLVAAKMDEASSRSQSQMSMASTASSQQSQIGIFGHATKFMNSVLGTSKKGKPEVKSLQLAAAAAKKQQEEKDKKAARLREMENRRQLASQRKAEEEKVRAMEEEKKIKEEGERRKREREECTDKKPFKGAAKKDEDNTKKRKVIVEVEKKPDVKKPPSKEKKDTAASRIGNPGLNASSNPTKASKIGIAKQPTPALTSSATYNVSQHVATSSSTVKVLPATADTKPFRPTSATPAMTKAKAKTASTQPPDDDLAQPSNIVQTQMAARVKAQMKAAKQTAEPTIASEAIELPDINSEYSDSEDEDRPRTFDPPDWAQSPELRQTLQMQSTVNPDDIFGAIRPLRMEEIFRTRQSRFRARTSSANWTGTDQLTIEEERDYARRMGFR